MTNQWQAHTGEDYTVVMRDDQTTDSASVRVYGGDAPQLALMIAEAMNSPPVITIPALMDLSQEDRSRFLDYVKDLPDARGLFMPSDTPRDVWFYDASSRTLYDENRLAVARDVGPDDAATILKAMGCEVDFAIVGEAEPNPLFQILDDMLAWELEAWESDGEIDGGDLVEAFGEWRSRLKNALAYSRPEPLWRVAVEAVDLFRDYAKHHRAKASEAGRPEKAQRNEAMADRLEAALGVRL